VLSLDDRTGNVLTTIALFVAVVGVAFGARATLVVSVFALLLAYLLEPAVGWVQRRLPSHSRAAAIALVYLICGAVLVAGGYAIEPAITGQLRRLNAGVPEMRGRLPDSQFLAQHEGQIAGAVERAGRPVAAAAEEAGWLLTVPIIAVFFLKNRQDLIDGLVDVLARTRDRPAVKHTIEQIDTMLGQYMRAMLITAILSVVFYSAAMALLKFPYPVALGVVGGALEFLPVMGWILAAAVMLLSGWLVHAHWIWMAVLLLVWRLVQNVVISPNVLGDRLQMEPVTVFVALMAGGQIAGIPGVILSVPVVAVLRILWLEHASRRKPAAA
jgi:predicted PurR-regulated permease PerM